MHKEGGEQGVEAVNAFDFFQGNVLSIQLVTIKRSVRC